MYINIASYIVDHTCGMARVNCLDLWRQELLLLEHVTSFAWQLHHWQRPGMPSVLPATITQKTHHKIHHKHPGGHLCMSDTLGIPTIVISVVTACN